MQKVHDSRTGKHRRVALAGNKGVGPTDSERPEIECTDLVNYLPLNDERNINSVSHLAVHWTRQNPAAAI